MNEITILIAAVVAAVLLWLAINRDKQPRYRRKSVLTGSDLDFFHRLQSALPECHVFPQVAMSALVDPMGRGRARQAAIESIVAKRVGYAVFDEEMQLLAVVELNHRSRVTRKDAARDEYFASAGIQTIRFQARHLPSEAKIRQSVLIEAQVRQRAASNSNACSSKMESRRQKTPWRNTANAHV
jgi:hypothetical protein